jgi:hypothetical protein
MPLKRRRPKERMVSVTPRALELFRQMESLRRGTDEWYDLHEQLHREMQARPWEYPLDSCNAPHIWEALEKAAEAAELREREKAAPTVA